MEENSNLTATQMSAPSSAPTQLPERMNEALQANQSDNREVDQSRTATAADNWPTSDIVDGAASYATMAAASKTMSTAHAFTAVHQKLQHNPQDDSAAAPPAENSGGVAEFMEESVNEHSESNSDSALDTKCSPDAVGSDDAEKKPGKKKKRSRPPSGSTAGRWTAAEHDAFLQGLSVYGREWKRVASDIPTRTSAQVRSHAQKYFAKLAKQEDDEFQQQQQQAHEHHLQPENHLEMSDSVRRQAARILSEPSTVEQEVKDTLQQLRERYRQLQERMQRQQQEGNESLASSVEEDELIALHVLQAGLEDGNAQQQQQEPN